MKKSELEKYIGKKVKVTLIFGNTCTGILNPVKYRPNFYTTGEIENGGVWIFRCSHVAKVKEVW